MVLVIGSYLTSWHLINLLPLYLLLLITTSLKDWMKNCCIAITGRLLRWIWQEVNPIKSNSQTAGRSGVQCMYTIHTTLYSKLQQTDLWEDKIRVICSELANNGRGVHFVQWWWEPRTESTQLLYRTNVIWTFRVQIGNNDRRLLYW